jgi:hypothetical protein
MFAAKCFAIRQRPFQLDLRPKLPLFSSCEFDRVSVICILGFDQVGVKAFNLFLSWTKECDGSR